MSGAPSELQLRLSPLLLGIVSYEERGAGVTSGNSENGIVGLLVEMLFLVLACMIWQTNGEASWKAGFTCPAEEKLATFEDEYRLMTNRLQKVDWNFATNMTSETRAQRDNFQPLYNVWMSSWKKWAKAFGGYDGVCSASSVELISMMKAGVVVQDPEKAKKVSELRTAMISYSAKENYNDLERYMAGTTDPEQLKSRWLQWAKWQDGSRVFFAALVSMLNEAAVSNGYRHYAESWNEGLDVEHESARLWEQVQPLYLELHAYVRGALLRRHGKEIHPNETIPVHLLGNPFGENWRNLADLAVPADLRRSPAERAKPERSGSASDGMRKADAHYQALGFPPMPPLFWKNSVFERPDNFTAMDCHPTAYDFGDGKDFRIKACLVGSKADEETAFHEMGHVQYFLAYRHQRSLFRTAPLAALHEAIGEAFGHAAAACSSGGAGSAPGGTHTDETEMRVNAHRDTVDRLLREALFKLVPLPWILSVEKWRYAVFQGRIPAESLASSLWDYREKFQGVKPPTPEARGYFDAGGKHHVSHFIPYFRYFFARFLDYQLLKAMCSDRHQETSMVFCCVDSETPAVRNLRHMMSFGASIEWREALQMATGTPEISAEPLLNYYDPLFVWLKRENIKLNNSVGW
ncbi:angiotensin-converting enzyme [Rhipicephalus sanguineus]|uniref:angiotensin-converting enzyme n=1 Tax=Rhipicephalus sanguineus TaxID=34632 RepID=UPI001894CE26|nr:angiotensin-converting enzyme [Rhipicephalus sanguineus]